MNNVMPCRYVFSRLLILDAIPKACGFEAATHFASVLLGGSLIPIVVIGMGMDFSLAKHVILSHLHFDGADFQLIMHGEGYIIFIEN